MATLDFSKLTEFTTAVSAAVSTPNDEDVSKAIACDLDEWVGTSLLGMSTTFHAIKMGLGWL